jgi:hypothetical protein
MTIADYVMIRNKYRKIIGHKSKVSTAQRLKDYNLKNNTH